MITVIGQHPAALEEWRPGVMTRMLVSSVVGARELCLFEQFVAPGAGAPTHTHTVEEVLAVLDGTAEIWLHDDRATLQPGHSVIIPPSVPHGFNNVGAVTLHVRATLAAAWFEARFAGQAEPRRRWQP
jgi:quercetin dioxygenase-like cupin family protein